MYAVARGADEVNRLKGRTYAGKDGVVAKKAFRGNCGDHSEDQTSLTFKEVDDQPPRRNKLRGFHGHYVRVRCFSEPCS